MTIPPRGCTVARISVEKILERSLVKYFQNFLFFCRKNFYDSYSPGSTDRRWSKYFWILVSFFLFRPYYLTSVRLPSSSYLRYFLSQHNLINDVKLNRIGSYTYTSWFAVFEAVTFTKGSYTQNVIRRHSCTMQNCIIPIAYEAILWYI